LGKTTQLVTGTELGHYDSPRWYGSHAGLWDLGSVESIYTYLAVGWNGNQMECPQRTFDVCIGTEYHAETAGNPGIEGQVLRGLDVQGAYPMDSVH
jgi:hypothetical protein